MKILLHQNAQFPVKVLSTNGENVTLSSTTCVAAFWELAEAFPEDVIGWCEEEKQEQLVLEKWQKIFHHDLIMASYAVETSFLPDSIGYVDQLPFVNYNPQVLYATWRMSSDVGGIKGEVLLKFKDLFGDISDFDYLLNSIAKTGQRNGLFCYSAPALVSNPLREKIHFTANHLVLFKFVSQHYTLFRSFVLLWCFVHYEKKYPMLSFAKSLFNRSYFQQKIDLSCIPVKSEKSITSGTTIDVILPTMGRPAHLKQVLEDLAIQELLPKKVIIIEQNPDKAATSALDEIHQKSWPFIIIHHFIHQTGACNARNTALQEITADWVFFCDDDNRFGPETLKTTISEIGKYGVDMLNTSYLQPEERPIYHEVKQWGTFGAGNAVVCSKSLQNIKFDPAFEHGYGEDKDFGMQLRNKGVDIVYHPGIEILHLKAAMGGFREKPKYLWDNEKTAPKPSPSLMVYAKKYYTMEQLRGFKVSLFLKYYNRQEIKNPLKYFKAMREGWSKSETWAEKLILLDIHRSDH